MGSLSYAIGGGLAGGGKAVEQFAAENMAELRMQKIEELRAGHQAALQQKGFEYEHGERELANTRAIAAAGATRQFQEQQQGKLFEQQKLLERERGATSKENVAAIVAGRENVARTKAEGANKPKPPGKDWSSRTAINPNAMFTDPQGNVTFGPKSTSILHHASGEELIEVNGRLIHFNGHLEDYEGNKGAQLASGLGKAKPADTDHLMMHPEDWSAFYQAHNYLPAQWQAHYTAYYDNQNRLYRSQGGSTTAEEPDSSAADDAADLAAANGPAPVGDGSYDSSYANTGDRGPQATDTAPAQ